MPIHLIIDRRGWSGYQARYGPYKATRTAYYSIARYGADEALRLAVESEKRFAADDPQPFSRTGPRGRLSCRNTSTIAGLRLEWTKYKTEERYLNVVGTWCRGARGYATRFSVDKHGPVEAVRLAMERRTKGCGAVFDISPRAAWERLKRAYGVSLRG